MSVQVVKIKDAVLPDPVRAYKLAGLNTGKPRHAGAVWQTGCPLHADGKTPSFTIYPEGGFHCFGCAEHGDIIAFYQALHHTDFQTACERLGELLAVSDSDYHQTITPPPRPQIPPSAELPALSQDIISTNHRRLMNDEKRLTWLTSKKALPVGTVKLAELGLGCGPCWSGLRYGIPIPDLHDGNTWRDIRGYSPKGTPKMLPWEKGRGRAQVYPWQWVCAANELVWCEGELDALNLIARGVPAVTATCGAGAATTASLTIPDLTGKTVRLLFDADEAGRNAAQALPERLATAGATKITRLDWPDEVPRGFDISDYFAGGGDIGGLGL